MKKLFREKTLRSQKFIIFFFLFVVCYFFFSIFLIIHKPVITNYEDSKYQISIVGKYPFNVISFIFGPIEYLALSENQNPGVDCLIVHKINNAHTTIELEPLYGLDLLSDFKPCHIKNRKGEIIITYQDFSSSLKKIMNSQKKN